MCLATLPKQKVKPNPKSASIDMNKFGEANFFSRSQSCSSDCSETKLQDTQPHKNSQNLLFGCLPFGAPSIPFFFFAVLSFSFQHFQRRVWCMGSSFFSYPFLHRNQREQRYGSATTSGMTTTILIKISAPTIPSFYRYMRWVKKGRVGPGKGT